MSPSPVHNRPRRQLVQLKDTRRSPITAHITGKLLQDVVGHPVIVFRPPVSRPHISRVMFEGNEVLPDTLLVNTFAGVAVGAEYSEANLTLLLDSSIRPVCAPWPLEPMPRW